MIIILPGFYLSLYRPSHKIIIFFPLFLEKSPESKSAQGHESPNTVLGKAVTIFTPADAFMFLPSTWTLHCTLFFLNYFCLCLFLGHATQAIVQGLQELDMT